MKKILFIIPPNRDSILTAPYGILSIISYINKSNEYDIRITEACKLFKTIKEFSADYVCISALFDSDYSYLRIISPIIKKFLPICMLVVGGGLATSMYRMILEKIPSIDTVCFGEGEIPMKKLLDGKESRALITKKSLWNIVPQHEFIQDLDEIPIIDFDYIDLNKYNNRSPAMTSSIVDKVEMNIHTSRGCPFNCIFCSNGNIHGKKIRYMSIGRVEETILSYVKNGMNTLLIEDDNFLINKKRALEILDIVAKYNLNVVFPNGLSVRGIDDDIARAFSKTGVEVVALAIESCCDFVLKELMDKPLTKKEIPKAVNYLRKYNIRVHAFIIIGLPNETDEHRLETLDFLINLGIDWVYIFIAVPITGSRLYEYCEEKGYLINNFNDYNITKCNIIAPGVIPEKIEECRMHMIMLINFVYNYNYANKKYSICLPYFEEASRKYNHIIANYMILETNKKIKEECYVV